MTEIMFERFGVAAFYVSMQACLALYTSGKITGTVLDSGYGGTRAVPIYEGYALPHAIKTVDFSGRDVTDYLMKLLNTSGQNFTTAGDREMVRDIKEKSCYVRRERQSSTDHQQKTTYKLPDGQELQLSEDQYLCPESLFTPSLCGTEFPGMHHLINQSITLCDVDIQTKGLYGNIVLAGGSTCFRGLPERLKSEVQSLSPSPEFVNVIAQDNRHYGAWEGGSILGSLRTFGSMWITKAEYEASGSDIVHRKCY